MKKAIKKKAQKALDYLSEKEGTKFELGERESDIFPIIIEGRKSIYFFNMRMDSMEVYECFLFHEFRIKVSENWWEVSRCYWNSIEIGV